MDEGQMFLRKKVSGYKLSGFNGALLHKRFNTFMSISKNLMFSVLNGVVFLQNNRMKNRRYIS